MRYFLLLVGMISNLLVAYPAHWWTPVSKEGAPSWEILPQEALPGEVILSKRNELGLLSNFAVTAFLYRGKKYASVEGFWQSLLYPEDSKDPRAVFPSLEWPFTRSRVEAMVAFDAKKAGDVAFANMKKMQINWVTFEGKRLEYWTSAKGDHYQLIVEVMVEKMKQNPRVREVLMATRGLTLRPDHHQEPGAPPAWKYFEIWIEIREKLFRDIPFDRSRLANDIACVDHPFGEAHHGVFDRFSS